MKLKKLYFLTFFIFALSLFGEERDVSDINSVDKSITFNGVIDLCCEILNIKKHTLNMKNIDISKLNSKERKIFPFRLSHYVTDISNIKKDFTWTPKYSNYDGFMDSYKNDFLKLI